MTEYSSSGPLSVGYSPHQPKRFLLNLARKLLQPLQAGMSEIEFVDIILRVRVQQNE